MKVYAVSQMVGVGKRSRAIVSFLTLMLAAILLGGCASFNLPAPHSRLEPLDPQDKFLLEKKSQRRLISQH